MADDRYAPDPDSPLPDPEPPTREEPRTGGDSATMTPVKVALGLLVVFMVLLVLFIAWPLISGA
jgi:hypothetical protein